MEKMELIGEQFPDDNAGDDPAIQDAVRSRVPAESGEDVADREGMHGDPAA